jgi:hypothetical protein
MGYVYIRSEPGLWTVGHYSPDGQWHTDSDHDRKDSAAARVIRLNGGHDDSEVLDVDDTAAGSVDDEVRSLVASIVTRERKDSIVDGVRQGIGSASESSRSTSTSSSRGQPESRTKPFRRSLPV